MRDNAAVGGFSVLLVEDDAGIGRVIINGLKNHEIAVDWLRTGESLLERLAEGAYHAIILDLMLPDADGFELCRRVRTAGVTTPICMLTARDALDDKLEGFDAGADDYLTKPFAMDELVARLRALVRRVPAEDRKAYWEHGDLCLDERSRELRINDHPVMLTRREFDALAHLIARVGEAVSREELLDAVWEADRSVTSNTVDVYMGYLRKKLAAAGSAAQIDSVRGFGFKLR